MTGPTQAAVAAAGWTVAAAPVLELTDVLAGLAVAVLASTIADLDHDCDCKRTYHPGGHGAAQACLPLGLGKLLGEIVQGLGFSQRGALHAFPAAPAVAGLITWAGTVWWPVWTVPAVVIGYLGGILPDALTTSGIPLRPGRGRLRLARFKVGGWVDKGLGVGAAVLTVFVLLQGGMT